jgi:hypothetical protein
MIESIPQNPENSLLIALEEIIMDYLELLKNLALE